MSHTEIVVDRTCSQQLEAGESAAPVAAPVAGPARRPASPVRSACQRGMVTAEYAVGILAAIALAMVLYGVVTDDQTHTALLSQVTRLIGQIGMQIK